MGYKAMFILFCFALACAAKTEENAGGVEFEVGGKKDDSNIKNLFNSINTPNKATPDDSESGDGSGEPSNNDNEIYSGSGSGENETATEVILDTVKTTQKPNKSTTPKITKTLPRKSSVVVITEVPTTNKTTTDNSGNEVRPTKPTQDPNNQPFVESENDEAEKAGVGFTIGIIIGVVVGAILAILVIVFLVYRLRKKDEGSYSLDESSSQAFIRDEKNTGGQGKEYFA